MVIIIERKHFLNIKTQNLRNILIYFYVKFSKYVNELLEVLSDFEKKKVGRNFDGKCTLLANIVELNNVFYLNNCLFIS